MGNFAFSNLISAVRLNGLGESFLPPMILNMTITGSIVILFVLLARLILKKAPKIFSYALWAVVLFRLLCPVSITTDFSLLGLFDTPAAENTQYTTAVEYVPYDVVHTPDLEVHLPVPPVINDAVNDALPQEHAALGADPLEGEFAIGSLVWLLGIGAMAIYSAVSYILLRRKLIGSVLLRDNIFLADGIGSPFVMGFIRPKIYLPSALSEQEQRYIILHEQHHIRRGDHIIKALAFIALCIHWFNPLVWVAFFLSSKDMEMSCDEAVVKKLGEGIRADYSASLLSLATGRRIIAGTPLAFGEGDTKSRIKNMLNWKKPKTWMLLVALVACVVAIVFCATNPRNDAAENDSMVVWELDQAYPDSVVDIVDDYVMQQVEYYNDLGSGENAIGGEYSILEAKVVGLERRCRLMGTETHLIELYRLEYRLLPSEPDHVVLAGGMQMEDGWITEYSSTGQPYFAILCDSTSDEETWRLMGMTNSDTINIEYNTDEMRAKHGDRYIAAAMEIYKAYLRAETQVSYDTAKDISYYLELAAGEPFQDMNLERQVSLLVEYEDLLDDYSLIARETEDGKTAYIVGQYNGNPTESPLYGMYGVEVASADGEDLIQFLYREEASETVNAVLEANKTDFPPSAGYPLEQSSIIWREDSGLVLILPRGNELSLNVAWNRYLYTPNGREYIADAVSRGIDVCGRTDTFLYFYLISERFGEIAERIALTEAEAQAILAEERVKITDGFGFSASLHIDGQTTYYNEREGIPQSVLDLAIEKCDYRFGDPSYITDTIREARLDCDWLDTTLYANEADLPRLREILKNAEHGYVGSCGYGAKLTLTFTGGEKLVVFKGCDGCDTIVFGSYGGYFLGEKENIEFWEMFGLDPETKGRVEVNPNDRELLYKDEEILISVPAQYAHLVKMDGLYSDDQYTNKANFYYVPEYFEHEAYTASRNGGWMLTVSTTLSSFAEASLAGHTSTYWTKDGTQVYVEQRPTGNYNCSNANLAEFKAVMDSIQVEYIGLEPFTETAPEQAMIPATHSQTALDTATNAVTTYLNAQFRNNPNTYRTEILYLEPDLVESTSAAVRYFQRTDDLAVANPAQAAQMIAVKVVYFQDWFLDTDSNQVDAGLQAKYFYMLPNEVVPDHWYIHDRKDTSAPSDIVSPVDSSVVTSYISIELKKLGSSAEEAIAQLDKVDPYLRTSAGSQSFRIYIRSGESPSLYIVTKDGRVGEMPLPYADESLIRAEAKNSHLDTNYDILCYEAEVEKNVRDQATGSPLSKAGKYRFIVDLESFTCAEIFTRTQEFTTEEVNFSGRTLTTTSDEMTYEERLSWVQAGPDYQQTHFTSLGQYAEGNRCIAYLGQWVGTPHMNQYRLDIRFSDGTTAYLPLPDDGGWGAVPPDTMVFQNGKFIYETSFPTTEVTNEGNTLIHLQGTYHYEVDLTAKTVSLTVLQ